MKNGSIEVVKLWKIGKQLGMSYDGKEQEILKQMEGMEVKDEAKKNRVDMGKKEGMRDSLR